MATAKPVIGIMPMTDSRDRFLYMGHEYLNAVSDAGGIPLVFPLTSDPEELRTLISRCDGLLFTGGHDVDPALYHEESIGDCVVTSPRRDAMEVPALSIAQELNKPILAICRGMQLINVALGGTLYQDLPMQHSSEIRHNQEPPFTEYAHTVTILPDTPLRAAAQAETLPVNTLHHQAVRELAPCLRPMALSPDGLIEGAYRPDGPFLWLIQWHPEYTTNVDHASAAIFTAFIDAIHKD